MNSETNLQCVPEQGNNSSSHNVVVIDTDSQDGLVQPPPPCAIIPTSMVQMDSTNSYVLLSRDFAPISGKVTTTDSLSRGTNQLPRHTGVTHSTIIQRHPTIQSLIQASGSSLTTGQSSSGITALHKWGTSMQSIPSFSHPSPSQTGKTVLATQMHTTLNDTKMIAYLKQRSSNHALVLPSESYSQFVEKFKVDTFRCLVQQLMTTGPASRRPGDWCVSDIMTKLTPFRMDSSHLQRIREKCNHKEIDVVRELLCFMYIRTCRKEISGTFLDHYWEAVLVCGQVPTYRPDDMMARRAFPLLTKSSLSTSSTETSTK